MRILNNPLPALVSSRILDPKARSELSSSRVFLRALATAHVDPAARERSDTAEQVLLLAQLEPFAQGFDRGQIG